MADFIKPKRSGEVVRREWAVPADADDAPSSVSTTGTTGVTVDSSVFEGNTLVLTLSAGTAAATGTIPVSITTDKARTLVETLYIPIIDSASQIADTARSYIQFAMRRITGIGEVPSSSELNDALERLEAMLAAWRVGGADIGATSPLTADTVIYCPDWAVSAIRNNLIVECADLYGADISPVVYERARRGLQLVKHKNLPDARKVEFY